MSIVLAVQHIRASRQAKRERGIWQHRMWGEKTGD